MSSVIVGRHQADDLFYVKVRISVSELRKTMSILYTLIVVDVFVGNSAACRRNRKGQYQPCTELKSRVNRLVFLTLLSAATAAKWIKADVDGPHKTLQFAS